MILWLTRIEDCVTEEYHPVTRNHEWQKIGACFTNMLPNEKKFRKLVSETSIHFSDSGIKRENVWGRATFFALIFAGSMFFVLLLKHEKTGKKMADLKIKPMKLTVFCGIHIFTRRCGFFLCVLGHTTLEGPNFLNFKLNC